MPCLVFDVSVAWYNMRTTYTHTISNNPNVLQQQNDKEHQMARGSTKNSVMNFFGFWFLCIFKFEPFSQSFAFLYAYSFCLVQNLSRYFFFFSSPHLLSVLFLFCAKVDLQFCMFSLCVPFFNNNNNSFVLRCDERCGNTFQAYSNVCIRGFCTQKNEYKMYRGQKTHAKWHNVCYHLADWRLTTLIYAAN